MKSTFVRLIAIFLLLVFVLTACTVKGPSYETSEGSTFEEPTEVTTKETTGEATEETTEETTEEKSMGTTVESTEGSTVETTKEPAEDLTEDFTEDLTEEPITETTEGVSDGTSVDTFEETTEDVTEKTVKETTEESTENTTEETTENITKETTEETTAETVEETTEAPLQYTVDGKYIYFGQYPQKDVTDATILEMLEDEIGAKPSPEYSVEGWTSFGAYMNGIAQDYMWYKDVVIDGEMYRGIYFVSYRPKESVGSEPNQYYDTNEKRYISSQERNGYVTENVYWFKYEPIKWVVLAQENGCAFLVCASIIDGASYQANTALEGAPEGKYINSYEYSTVRAWLNNDFYNTAFTPLQQVIIQTTDVRNDIVSAAINSSAYASPNTQDKVFLLSHEEVNNKDYGFPDEYGYDGGTHSYLRRRSVTRYARAIGVLSYTGTYVGCGDWWLRSPKASLSCAKTVQNTGGLFSQISVHEYLGVVPALWIKL